MMTKNLLLALLILPLLAVAQTSDTTLTVQFKGIKMKKGDKVFVALYNSEATFLKKPVKGTIARVVNGEATAIFKDIPPGTYAISSFYDKNANGKLDTNFLGIPKEPTGMSNNAKGRMGPPKYKDAKFELKAHKTIKINY